MKFGQFGETYKDIIKKLIRIVGQKVDENMEVSKMKRPNCAHEVEVKYKKGDKVVNVVCQYCGRKSIIGIKKERGVDDKYIFVVTVILQRLRLYEELSK